MNVSNLLFALLSNRYSGKTQKQIIEFVRDNYVKRQTFQRFAFDFVLVVDRKRCRMVEKEIKS